MNTVNLAIQQQDTIAAIHTVSGAIANWVKLDLKSDDAFDVMIDSLVAAKVVLPPWKQGQPIVEAFIDDMLPGLPKKAERDLISLRPAPRKSAFVAKYGKKPTAAQTAKDEAEKAERKMLVSNKIERRYKEVVSALTKAATAGTGEQQGSGNKGGTDATKYDAIEYFTSSIMAALAYSTDMDAIPKEISDAIMPLTKVLDGMESSFPQAKLLRHNTKLTHKAKIVKAK